MAGVSGFKLLKQNDRSLGQFDVQLHSHGTPSASIFSLPKVLNPVEFENTSQDLCYAGNSDAH